METKEGVKPETAVYEIHKTLWKQEQLTYGEIQEILKLSGLKSLKELSLDSGIENIMINIIQSDIIGDILKIILKPHNPNLWIKIKNWFYSRNYKHINRNIIAQLLQLWEVKKILQDFFILNISWMLSSMNMQFISDLATLISSQTTIQENTGQMKQSTA